MTPDLRLGRWQDVLADVPSCDALICDPPYSQRTHKGVVVGSHPGGKNASPYYSGPIAFNPWDDSLATEFVEAWAPRTRSWMVIMSDHETGLAIQRAMRKVGRYAFAPVPFIEMGKQPRVHGDGPASWTCWIFVSRPREQRFKHWGSLPGAYVPQSGLGIQSDREIKGGKPLWLMRALVRDYSHPGDLVCDPFAGGGTTLLAAAIEGRRSVGAEVDAVTLETARKRIARGYTPSLFTERPGQSKSHQLDLPMTRLRKPLLAVG
jgi:site-specific DNA-methyltransferase (adenine-specific)